MSDQGSLRQLAWLIASPDQSDQVRLEEIPELLGALEAVKARLWNRLNSPSLPDTPPKGRKPSDHLLDAKEAAERLGVKPKWLYSHADRLPFTRRLGGRTLRFSEQGLIRWMESRRVS